MNLFQKLIEVRKVVPYLQKENAGNQYKYVSSSQVLANVRAMMDELGLLLVPSVEDHKVSTETIEYMEKEKPKKTTTYFTELVMTMTWINAEKPEEKISCNWYGQGVDIAGEKGVGKALTYAEKYFMLKFFNIATDKDDPDTFQEKHEPEVKIDQTKVNALMAMATQKGASDDWIKKNIKARYGHDSKKDLTTSQFKELMDYLATLHDKKKGE
ncbi:MAG TPA: ERF family protein [Patescibacteria group bacterium]|nr:ERF family protein [Patescibacteria group bacterium]